MLILIITCFFVVITSYITIYSTWTCTEKCTHTEANVPTSSFSLPLLNLLVSKPDNFWFRIAFSPASEVHCIPWGNIHILRLWCNSWPLYINNKTYKELLLVLKLLKTGKYKYFQTSCKIHFSQMLLLKICICLIRIKCTFLCVKSNCGISDLLHCSSGPFSRLEIDCANLYHVLKQLFYLFEQRLKLPMKAKLKQQVPFKITSSR